VRPRPRPRTPLLLVAAVALATAACGGEGEIPDLRADGSYDGLAPTGPGDALPTDDGTATVTSSSSDASDGPTVTPTAIPATASPDTPAATPSPTVSETETATETPTEATPDDGETVPGDDGQTYRLDPSDPVEADAGEAVEVSFVGRYDDRDMPGSVDVLLVVCDGVEVTDGELRFLDDNGEGTADGRLSDPSRAAITALNGTDVDARASVSGLLLRDGQASVTVEAQECVWVVFLTDGDGDGELAVDDEDQPRETFGAVRVDV
jgi:hypothetical protein